MSIDFADRPTHWVPPGAKVTECCSLPLDLVEDGHATTTVQEFVSCPWTS